MLSRKGQALIIAIFLTMIIGGIVAVLVLSQSNKFSITGNVIADGENTNTISNIFKNCRDVEVPYEETETYYETVPYTDEECETKELAYNIEDINVYLNACTQEEERCLEYFLGFCIEVEEYCVEKKVGCSVTINNVDNEKGYWSFDFNILEWGTENIADSQKRSSTILAQDSQLFQTSATFTGEENAEKDYYCRVKNLKPATKQICEGVTKYKDVLRTKTVTKYRTEEVCD